LKDGTLSSLTLLTIRGVGCTTPELLSLFCPNAAVIRRLYSIGRESNIYFELSLHRERRVNNKYHLSTLGENGLKRIELLSPRNLNGGVDEPRFRCHNAEGPRGRN
jgi:hypothetical protein